MVLAAYTHNYALFLFPAILFSLLIPPYHKRVLPVLITLFIATVCYLPWLNVLIHQTHSDSYLWMASFFKNLPPLLAPLRSLEVLGAGGLYPIMNYELALQKSLRWFSITLYGLVFFSFLFHLFKNKEKASLSSNLLLLFFLFIPLLFPWAYSLIKDPIYVVGRHDMIVLPFYYLILGISLSAFPRILKLILTSFMILFSLYTLYPYYFQPMQLLPKKQVLHIKEYLKNKDIILYTDLRGSGLRVYFKQQDLWPKIVSFPAEIDQHPGWFSAKKLDPKKVVEEANQIIQTYWLEGKRVWVVGLSKQWPYGPLLAALQKKFYLSKVYSKPELNLYCFIPIGSPLPLSSSIQPLKTRGHLLEAKLGEEI